MKMMVLAGGIYIDWKNSKLAEIEEGIFLQFYDSDNSKHMIEFKRELDVFTKKWFSTEKIYETWPRPKEHK